jgi:hypothetical protein
MPAQIKADDTCHHHLQEEYRHHTSFVFSDSHGEANLLLPSRQRIPEVNITTILLGDFQPTPL